MEMADGWEVAPSRHGRWLGMGVMGFGYPPLPILRNDRTADSRQQSAITEAFHADYAPGFSGHGLLGWVVGLKMVHGLVWRIVAAAPNPPTKLTELYN